MRIELRGATDGWVVKTLRLERGARASYAVLERTYCGAEIGDIPHEIEIFHNETRLFAGSAIGTKTNHSETDPFVQVKFADARHKLALMPTPARYEVRGDSIVRSGGAVVFNAKGEYDHALGANAFSCKQTNCDAWSGLDALRYLVEYGFEGNYARGTVFFDINAIPCEISSRLGAHRPMSLDVSDMSLIDAAARLLEPVGAEIALAFDGDLPRICVTRAICRDTNGISLDCGTAKGSLIPNLLPDVCGFELTEHNALPPAQFELRGINAMLEVTLRTGMRAENGVFVPSSVREGDLTPAWSVEEERRYNWVWGVDPAGADRDFDHIRAGLWRVHRLYTINQRFDFASFFGGKVEAGAEFEPCAGFAFLPDGSTIGAEVLLSHIGSDRLHLPYNEYGEAIGIALSSDRASIKFDRPVALCNCADPSAVRVSCIAYTLCLKSRDSVPVIVDSADVFGSAVTSGQCAKATVRAGFIRRVAPNYTRHNRPNAVIIERNDLPSALVLAHSLYERYSPYAVLRCSLDGLRADISPCATIGRLTFENSSGGVARSPIQICAPVRTVEYDAQHNTTTLHCAPANGFIRRV